MIRRERYPREASTDAQVTKSSMVEPGKLRSLGNVPGQADTLGKIDRIEQDRPHYTQQQQ